MIAQSSLHAAALLSYLSLLVTSVSSFETGRLKWAITPQTGCRDTFYQRPTSTRLVATAQEPGSYTGGPFDIDSEPSLPDEVIALKEQLLVLADQTSRGFQASDQQRKAARRIIFRLATYNPTAEPVRAYYPSSGPVTDNQKPSLTGKWTLVYTDAPDITSLQGNLLAELGRIGQECHPPTIKNVIEWRQPAWAAGLPLAGPSSSRVLQKVVTQAKSDPKKPLLVDLDLAGVQVETDASAASSNLAAAIAEQGLVAGLVGMQPLDLQGPLKAPFGQFEVLYLDDEMRIIKTGQNYVAVNVRPEVEWF